MEDIEDYLIQLKEEAVSLTKKLNDFHITDNESLIIGLKMLLRAEQIKDELLTLLKSIKEDSDPDE